MLGKIHYPTKVSGNPDILGNQIDAIFCKDKAGKEFDVMIYNYNASSLNYKTEEIRLHDRPQYVRLHMEAWILHRVDS